MEMESNLSTIYSVPIKCSYTWQIIYSNCIRMHRQCKHWTPQCFCNKNKHEFPHYF